MIISSDEANRYLQTVVIVPLTSTIRDYPTRLLCEFQGRTGQLALDQIRSIDKSRLDRKLGKIDIETAKKACLQLMETFRF